MRGSDSLNTCVGTRVAVCAESDYGPIAARYRSDVCDEMEPRYSIAQLYVVLLHLPIE